MMVMKLRRTYRHHNMMVIRLSECLFAALLICSIVEKIQMKA
jgi:hypothetical protein